MTPSQIVRSSTVTREPAWGLRGGVTWSGTSPDFYRLQHSAIIILWLYTSPQLTWITLRRFNEVYQYPPALQFYCFSKTKSLVVFKMSWKTLCKKKWAQNTSIRPFRRPPKTPPPVVRLRNYWGSSRDLLEGHHQISLGLQNRQFRGEKKIVDGKYQDSCDCYLTCRKATLVLSPFSGHL